MGLKITKFDPNIKEGKWKRINVSKMMEGMSNKDYSKNPKLGCFLVKESGRKIGFFDPKLDQKLWEYMNYRCVWNKIPYSQMNENRAMCLYILANDPSIKVEKFVPGLDQFFWVYIDLETVRKQLTEKDLTDGNLQQITYIVEKSGIKLTGIPTSPKYFPLMNLDAVWDKIDWKKYKKHIDLILYICEHSRKKIVLANVCSVSLNNDLSTNIVLDLDERLHQYIDWTNCEDTEFAVNTMETTDIIIHEFIPGLHPRLWMYMSLRDVWKTADWSKYDENKDLFSYLIRTTNRTIPVFVANLEREFWKCMDFDAIVSAFEESDFTDKNVEIIEYICSKSEKKVKLFLLNCAKRLWKYLDLNFIYHKMDSISEINTNVAFTIYVYSSLGKKIRCSNFSKLDSQLYDYLEYDYIKIDKFDPELDERFWGCIDCEKARKTVSSFDFKRNSRLVAYIVQKSGVKLPTFDPDLEANYWDCIDCEKARKTLTRSDFKKNPGLVAYIIETSGVKLDKFIPELDRKFWDLMDHDKVIESIRDEDYNLNVEMVIYLLEKRHFKKHITNFIPNLDKRLWQYIHKNAALKDLRKKECYNENIELTLYVLDEEKITTYVPGLDKSLWEKLDFDAVWMSLETLQWYNKDVSLTIHILEKTKYKIKNIQRCPYLNEKLIPYLDANLVSSVITKTITNSVEKIAKFDPTLPRHKWDQMDCERVWNSMYFVSEMEKNPEMTLYLLEKTGRMDSELSSVQLFLKKHGKNKEEKITKFDPTLPRYKWDQMHCEKVFWHMNWNCDLEKNPEMTLYLLEKTNRMDSNLSPVQDFLKKHGKKKEKITRYDPTLPKSEWGRMDCQRVWDSMPWRDIDTNPEMSLYMLEKLGRMNETTGKIGAFLEKHGKNKRRITKFDPKLPKSEWERMDFQRVWNEMPWRSMEDNIEMTLYLLEKTNRMNSDRLEIRTFLEKHGKNKEKKITKFDPTLPKSKWGQMDCRRVWTDMPWLSMEKNPEMTLYILEKTGKTDSRCSSIVSFMEKHGKKNKVKSVYPSLWS